MLGKISQKLDCPGLERANNRFEWDAPTAGFAACFRAPQAQR
jgi:hypothetical protein